MKAVWFAPVLLSIILLGCVFIQHPSPPPIYTPLPLPATPTPQPSPTPTPTSSPTPSPSPTQTPTPSPTPPIGACEEIIRDQIYALYHPTYCTGMPPCTPLTEQEVKALITIDLSHNPITFTYQSGSLCRITTYYGRAWVDKSCILHDPEIIGEDHTPVPC